MIPVKQVNTNNSSLGSSCGLLIWWTIHQKLHNVATLKTSAESLLVDPDIVLGIVGASPTNAFSKALNLGVGLQDKQPDISMSARFITRKADNDSWILAWELVEKGNKRVKLEQIGVFTLENDALVFSEDPVGFVAHKPPSQIVVDVITCDFHQRIGSIDDIKIRSLLLQWLEKQHRVCLRNTGGLYFVPGKTNPVDHAKLLNDAISIRNWVMDQGIGSFSIIEVYDTPATSITDLVESSLLELQSEIEEVGGKLEGYENSVNMNAGSRGYSAGTAIDRVNAIESKILSLQSALGDNLDLAVEMLKIVKDQALAMKRVSDLEVAHSRAEKAGNKPATKRRKVKVIVK